VSRGRKEFLKLKAYVSPSPGLKTFILSALAWGGRGVVRKVFARKKLSFSHFSSSPARKDARGIVEGG